MGSRTPQIHSETSPRLFSLAVKSALTRVNLERSFYADADVRGAFRRFTEAHLAAKELKTNKLCALSCGGRLEVKR